MSPAAAMQAALHSDRDRQILELWRQVIRTYGVNQYHRNQAYNWWGWPL